MKHRMWSVLSLIVTLLLAVSLVPASATGVSQEPSLVQIRWRDAGDLAAVEAAGVEVYARLSGGAASFLAGALPEQIELLQADGLAVVVLDPDMAGATYYLASARPSRPAPDWDAYGRVLLADGATILLRIAPRDAERLALAGAEISAVNLTPKPVRPTASEGAFPTAIEPDPLIQTMIDQIDLGMVYDYTGGISGEWPVEVGGDPYTISTRNTYSGTPIQKATQFAGEHLAGLGLAVEYHQWGGASYPNVIAELPGLINPEEIWIICGHIDDMPSGGSAPGADDNGSGTVTVLIAADILTQYQWGSTLRFALWTGEEQGLLGSHAYAQRAYNYGENIAGVLNLDMVAWNTGGSSPDIDIHADSSIPPTLELAQLMADVVDAYNLNLIPDIEPDGTGASDHASFWDYGYTAILGIEDFSDFNPYYHTVQDDMDNFEDWPYYIDFVKASVATFAHMSNSLIPSGIGTLDGHVTAASGGAPIPGAAIAISDDQGHTYSATADANGYYNRTLLAGTYTVSASAYGYLPVTVTGVEVVEDQTTTQDLALQTAPLYAVQGQVTDAVTGIPLDAQVEFEGSPVTVWTDANGHYQATLPQGEYTMVVTSAGHQPEERAIVLDQNQTQNFSLEPLPCILLVDDDNNAPDTTPYFTAALDAMGLDYDIFVTGGGNGPDLAGLMGYKMVFWYSGDTFGGTAGPDSTDEANLAAYLDAGGNLFLSSQDYLYDWGLTTFGSTYLGIGSYTDDSGDATSIVGIAGDPIGGGLGPYSLTYPAGLSDYGDIVNAGAGASNAFKANNNANKLDTDKDGGAWKTVFFGTDWAPLYNNNATNGITVLQKIVDWFGGCEPPPPQHYLHINKMKMNWKPGNPPYYKVIAQVRVYDEAQLPAVGAEVYGEWTYPDGQVVPVQGVIPTDDQGRTKFQAKEPQCGIFELCVTDIVKAGFSYDPAANQAGPCMSIQVQCK